MVGVDVAIVLGEGGLDDLAPARHIIGRDEAGQPTIGQSSDAA